MLEDADLERGEVDWGSYSASGHDGASPLGNKVGEVSQTQDFAIDGNRALVVFVPCVLSVIVRGGRFSEFLTPVTSKPWVECP